MSGLSIAIAFTQHFILTGDYNEVHPSIRYTKDNFIAGAFLNSESKISPYAGLRFETGDLWLEGGAVLGYSAAKVAPYVRLGYDVTDNVAVFAAPAYGSLGTVGFVAGVEIKLGN